MSPFAPQNLFSQISRQRCIINLKSIPVPKLGKKTPSARAAVLIPLCVIEDRVSLLYTVRSAKLRSHSGQISFPGGKIDDGETPIDAALRETYEEVGVKAKHIDIWGEGASVPGRDNKILITPIVGSVDDFKLEHLKLNPDEVTGVFTVPIEALCDYSCQFHTQFQNGFILPVFLYEKFKIWGLTAYMTHTLLASLLPKEVYRNEWMRKKVVIKEFNLKTL